MTTLNLHVLVGLDIPESMDVRGFDGGIATRCIECSKPICIEPGVVRDAPERHAPAFALCEECAAELVRGGIEVEPS